MKKSNIISQVYPDVFVEESYEYYKYYNLGFKTFEQFLAYKWGLYESTARMFLENIK